MSIVSINPGIDYFYAINPCVIFIDTTDSIATVMSTGYLNGQPTPPVFGNKQMCLVNTTDGLIWLEVLISGANTNLIYPQSKAVVSSQSSASRTLNSGFQISSTKGAFVTYSVDVACTISLTAGQIGTVYLEIASDSGFTTNLQEVGRFVNGNSGTLTIGLNLTQTATGNLGGYVPAGMYCRLRTANTSGSPTFTYRSGQEALL